MAKIIYMVNNNKKFNGLYDYFTAQEHYTNHGTNFNTNMLVFLKSSREPCTVNSKQSRGHEPDSWKYIHQVYYASTLIKDLVIARRILYSLNKNTQDDLMLTFYGSPGKFSSKVRTVGILEYKKKYVDLTMLMFKHSNLTSIEQFEKLEKKKLEELAKLAKKSFIISISEFYKVWDENEKENNNS
jgi:hypothetical protein